MKKTSLYFGLLVLLSGCAATPNLQPSITSMVSTKTARSTLTLPPVSTTTPSAVPSKTATQPAEPTGTPPASPTPNLVATVMAAEPSRLYASYPSPDEMWRVDVVIYDCIQTSRTDEGGRNENAYEQVRLVNLTSGDEQVVDEQLQFCGGLGAYGFDGRFWSPNSRYFYYTTARQGVPDGCGYWVPPLYRVDVNTSAKPKYLGMGTRSPDGKKLAVWNWPENNFTIWSIDEVEDFKLSAMEALADIGPMTWSPDSRSLVYLQVDSWCPLSGKSYLVLVNVTQGEQNLLIASESPIFGNVEWNLANELNLFDENGKGWRYDLQTHELVQNP